VKARSNLLRLEALEAAERERVAADVAIKEERATRAIGRLSPADRTAVHEYLDAQEEGSEWWEEVCKVGDAVSGLPVEDPVGEAARAWWETLEDIPDGVPHPLPPIGAAAYFEREAARCDLAAEQAPKEVLPDSVSLEAVQTAARWSAGWWRYQAAYALELTTEAEA